MSDRWNCQERGHVPMKVYARPLRRWFRKTVWWVCPHCDLHAPDMGERPYEMFWRGLRGGPSIIQKTMWDFLYGEQFWCTRPDGTLEQIDPATVRADKETQNS